MSNEPMHIYVVDWKAEPLAVVGDDPDSFIRREGAEAFQRFIDNARPYCDWLIDQAAAAYETQDVYQRATSVRTLIEVAKLATDPVIRAHYRSRIASLAGLDEEDIRGLMGERAGGTRRPQGVKRSNGGVQT